MKSLTRTIIVLAVFNLATGNFALAQNAPGENVPESSAEPAARARVRRPTPPKPPPTEAEPPSVEPAEPMPSETAPGAPSPAAPPRRGPVQFVTRTTQPTGLTRSASRKVLVIPTTEVKTEELVAITQDLHVMSHIFDERFKQPRPFRGKLFGEVFTDFGDFFGWDSRATEAIYLQGYGALFLMEVNFAFSPPPKEQEKEAKKTEDVDPIWQRARQQIFSPKDPMMGRGARSEQQGYSAEKIEQLKAELTRTLKHAANIRNLKPDEWVILTVIGKGRQPGEIYEDYYRSAAPRDRTSTSGRSRRSSSRGRGGFGGGGAIGGGSFGGGVMMGGQAFGGGMYGGMEYDGDMEYDEIGPPSATVLTIRAKKSDVDAFAKGELDFEQFQQKVEIFTY